jgi:hypothetical protein
VTSIDAISVEHPNIAAVLRMSELSEALRSSTAELVIDAQSRGKTSVTIDTTFDDGTKRQVEAEISVEAADRMVLEHTCRVEEPQDRDWFPPGAEVPLIATLYRGNVELVGEQHKSILSGSGVTRTSGGLVLNRYSWTSPDTSGTTTFTSPLLSNFSAKYRTYALEQLRIDSIVPRYDLSETQPYDGHVLFDASLSVAGKRPCLLPSLRIETLTPEVCGGYSSDPVWSTEPYYGVTVRVHKSGTCQLVVSIEGTETSYPVEFPITVEEPPPGTVDPCEDVVCGDKVTECPAGSELVTQSCCSACAPVLNAALCESERSEWDLLYEAQRAGKTACKVDTDCSTTVLAGGCRRYCYLPFAAQQIAPFMNAVAEAYHTSCPHCDAGEPAPCEPMPTGMYCEQGECKLRY